MLDCPYCGMPLEDDGTCLTDGCEQNARGQAEVIRIFDVKKVSRFRKETRQEKADRLAGCAAGCFGCARQRRSEYRPVLMRGNYGQCEVIAPASSDADFYSARAFLDGEAERCGMWSRDQRPSWGSHPWDWVDPNPPTLFDKWKWSDATKRANARLREWEIANGYRKGRRDDEDEPHGKAGPSTSQRGLWSDK